MKICFNCGKPQQGLAGTSAPQWEYCEIEYELLGLLGMRTPLLAPFGKEMVKSGEELPPSAVF
jgi:hypothetical protein